jgi:hypothetical protein
MNRHRFELMPIPDLDPTLYFDADPDAALKLGQDIVI